MKYLVEPHNGIWVAANDTLSRKYPKEKLKKDLRQRIMSVQTWFFDLDDNHTDSPAKKIAYNAVGTHFLNPRFIHWALTQGAPAKFNKSKESLAWEKYINNFLRSEDAIQKIQEIFTEENAIQSLYGGVQDFVSLISDANRFYVTRNIKEVAESYKSAIGLNGFFAETNNKGRIVEKYLNEHPEIRIIGVDGESEEDAEMIGVAKFYGIKVISIYSMDKPKNSQMNQKFNYAVSKDRSGLVELLRT